MVRGIPPFLLLMLFSGCDQVKEPVPPSPPASPGGPRLTSWVLENSYLVAYVYHVGTDEVLQAAERKILGEGTGTSGTNRTVLLEDFTGHRCNNCPAAAATAQQIHDQYPNDVIVVGVHVTEQFAAPLPNSPDGSYTTDFRTAAGNAYEQAFGVSWLPAGMVSRRVFGSSPLLPHNAWPQRVAELVNSPSPFEIWFETLEFDGDNNLLQVEVRVRVLEPVKGSYNLVLYLTEDHVIDWQYDAQSTPPNIPDYEHRHVLRDNINGIWGMPVIQGGSTPGEVFTLVHSNYRL
jgi:thiol-disulfide isomerase/thioredoxin